MSIVYFPTPSAGADRKKRIWRALGALRRAQHEVKAIDTNSEDIEEYVTVLGQIAECIICSAFDDMKPKSSKSVIAPFPTNPLEVTCMATYKSETVTVVSTPKQGDRDFDAANPKVKIKHADGREEAVPKAEVQE